eukprot:6469367-Amphidinium_carterae.1
MWNPIGLILVHNARPLPESGECTLLLAAIAFLPLTPLFDLHRSPPRPLRHQVHNQKRMLMPRLSSSSSSSSSPAL